LNMSARGEAERAKSLFPSKAWRRPAAARSFTSRNEMNPVDREASVRQNIFPILIGEGDCVHQLFDFPQQAVQTQSLGIVFRSQGRENLGPQRVYGRFAMQPEKISSFFRHRIAPVAQPNVPVYKGQGRNNSAIVILAVGLTTIATKACRSNAGRSHMPLLRSHWNNSSSAWRLAGAREMKIRLLSDGSGTRVSTPFSTMSMM
jgi:hypothetical protein